MRSYRNTPPTISTTGFTLIEVVIAVGLLAIISTMIFQSLSQTFTTRDMLDRSQTSLHGARVAIQRLSDDLASTFLSPYKIKGYTDEKQPTRFLGNAKELTLTSMTHLRLFRNVRESDQSELTYLLEDDPKAGRQNLVRKEYKRIEIERAADQEPVSLVLVEGVHDFKLRYCNGEKGEWTEEWDTTKSDFKDKLPLAVEVSIVVNPDPENDKPLEDDLFTLKTIAFIERLFEQARSGNQKLTGCSDEKLF